MSVHVSFTVRFVPFVAISEVGAEGSDALYVVPGSLIKADRLPAASYAVTLAWYDVPAARPVSVIAVPLTVAIFTPSRKIS